MMGEHVRFILEGNGYESLAFTSTKILRCLITCIFGALPRAFFSTSFISSATYGGKNPIWPVIILTVDNRRRQCLQCMT